MDKYNNHTYKTGSSHGGSNINFNLITYEDKITFTSIFQSHV